MKNSLLFIGWSIIIIGVIGGFIALESYTVIGIIAMVGSIFEGMIFIALSKILESVENTEVSLIKVTYDLKKIQTNINNEKSE